MDITNDKLHDALDAFLDAGLIDNFVNIDIDQHISQKLYDYQIIHLYNLISSSKTSNVLIDSSDTGTGKTYTSLALCAQLKYRPYIICPKTVMSIWSDVCKYFNVIPLAIVNYETARLACEYENTVTRTRAKSRYITYNDTTKEFSWKLPNNAIVIFDEVHKCKNTTSLNGKLLLSVKSIKHCLLLSATIADNIQAFGVYGYLLGFYKTLKQSKGWINAVIREDKNANRSVSSIYKKIYPIYGSRMLIQELGDKFPENQIIAACYDIMDDSLVNKYYDNMYDNIKKLQYSKCDKGDILKHITESRKQIEYSKVDIIKELAQDYIENNHSIVIFVNYKKTLFQLSKLLNCTNLLYGDVSENDRTKLIKSFQNNKINLLLCITKVGGQSISLNDTTGTNPRVSIISPTFSSIDLQQVLGRIYRVGTKSRVLQRIVFCANTYEEHICKKIMEKIQFIQTINNADLLGINFDMDTIKKHKKKK